MQRHVAAERGHNGILYGKRCLRGLAPATSGLFIPESKVFFIENDEKIILRRHRNELLLRNMNCRFAALCKTFRSQN